MSAAQIDAAEVLARTPLVELVGRTVPLKRVGRLFKGCCPLHGEKTPSFTVYPDQHFHCFGCGAHGDAIIFIERTEGLSWGEALTKLAAEAGLVDRKETTAQRAKREKLDRERVQREAERVAKEAAEQERRAGWVSKRIAATVPVAGTLGEKYLTGTRGIPRPIGGWPDCVRFDRTDKAVVVAATANGKVQAGQWIHLTDAATKAPDTDRRPTKQTRGPVKGTAVRLPGRADGPLQVAEGPETGLSVWLSTGCETWIGPVVSGGTNPRINGDASVARPHRFANGASWHRPPGAIVASW